MNSRGFEDMRRIGLKMVDEAREAGDIGEVERLQALLATHKEIFDTAKAQYQQTGYSRHFYFSFHDECRGCGKFHEGIAFIDGEYYGNVCEDCRPPAVKPIEPPAHWRQEQKHETI